MQRLKAREVKQRVRAAMLVAITKLLENDKRLQDVYMLDPEPWLLRLCYRESKYRTPIYINIQITTENSYDVRSSHFKITDQGST